MRAPPTGNAAPALAAVAALVLLGLPAWAADEPTRCLQGDRPINAEIETSLGTIGLCLIDDRSPYAPEVVREISLITQDFTRAARRGDFDDSFFHLAEHEACPDEEGEDCPTLAATIRGGSFRLAAGKVAVGNWSPASLGSSILQNAPGTIAVVRDGTRAEWLINVADNAGELDSQAHPFGLVILGTDVVNSIANLLTLDASRPPSKVSVRLPESGCLSGEVPAAFETCPCGEGNLGGGSCVECVGPDAQASVAERYRETLQPELWVRADGESDPCISGDQSPELTCVCSDEDKLEGTTCVAAETYFAEPNLWVRIDGESDPCISGDQDPEPSCVCSDADKADGVCVPATSYADTLVPELWVRDEQEGAPCISGDDFDDTCVCSFADRSAGICVAAETYLGLGHLWVRDDGVSAACITGDEHPADEACRCAIAEISNKTCVSGSSYLDELSNLQLQVRLESGQPACIFGDQDPSEEDCDCDDAESCISYDLYRQSQSCDLWVRLDDASGPCLTGEDCWENLPPTCESCESGDAACVAAQFYAATLTDIWVRLPTAPCISGDDLVEDCVCSEADKDDGICVPLADYESSFDAKHQKTQTLYVSRPHPAACLSGDVETGTDPSVCSGIDFAAGRCVSADDYLASVWPSELWVRDDEDDETEPCINGDQEDEAEECECTDAEKEPGGICPTFADYVSSFEAQVRVRGDACIFGDGVNDPACDCAIADSCVLAEAYLDTRPELFVRDDGPPTEPCISGDQEGDAETCDCTGTTTCKSLDNYLESFPTPTTPFNAQALHVRLGGEPCISGDDGEALGSCPCTDAEILDGTCVSADAYLADFSSLWVRDDDVSEPCISGDEPTGEEECLCKISDIANEICRHADAYLADFSSLWVRDDGESEPCISGDEAQDSCVCEAEDREAGTCIAASRYVKKATPSGRLLVRLAAEPCISGDAGEALGSCPCSETDLEGGICIAAEDYPETFPLDWIRHDDQDQPCISGDDDEADETCVCAEADKRDEDCVTNADRPCESANCFLTRLDDPDLRVRPTIEACLSTDHITGDASCRCDDLLDDPDACPLASDYLLDRLADGGAPPPEPGDFTQLPINTSSTYPSVVDISSSGLVMIRSVIPEPSSAWLQAASLLTLSLLARARSRRQDR